jgi:hypothetical protein
MPVVTQHRPVSSVPMVASFPLLGLLLLAACDGGIGSSRIDPLDATPSDTAADLVEPADVDLDTTPDTLFDSNELPPDVPTDIVDDASAEIVDDASADIVDDANSDVVVDPVPPAIVFTIAEIPPEMNGSIDSVEAPLSWVLRANRSHLTLDVIAAPDSGPIDWETLEIHCDDGSGERPMDPTEAVSSTHHRHLVTPANPLDVSPTVVCRAEVAGPHGRASDALAFEAADLPPELDPFTTVDTWYITFSRDLFDLTFTARPDNTATLSSRYLEGGNGIEDIDEAFFALGLMSSNHPESAAIIRAHIERRIAANLKRFYGVDGADPLAPRLDFRFEGTSEAAAYADQTPEALNAAGVSVIAVGGDGDPDDQRAGTFGRAWIDWNNQDAQDNTTYGLGVFPTALVRTALEQPIAAIVLADFRPDLGGIPFGALDIDAAFIGRDETPTELPSSTLVDVPNRAAFYKVLVDFASLGLASILAHEIGHSLGLVPYGPPPEGLFAGVAVDFVASIAPDAHIDTPGLNIMQTGGSIDIASVLNGDEPAFEPLSRAYLRRMLVVGPPSPR